MEEVTQLSTLYWTSSSCIYLLPILEISLLLKKRGRYLFRIVGSIVLYILISYWIAKIMPHTHSIEAVPFQIFTCCILMFCNEMSLKTAIYLKTLSMAFEFLGQQIACLLSSIFFNEYFYDYLLFMKLITSIFIFGFFFLYLKHILRKVVKIPATVVAFSVLIAVIGIMFNSISFEYLQVRTSITFLYQTFCMLSVILALHVQILIYGQQKAQNEVALMNRLWLEQQKQFEIKKEYMDLVNQKYHDLKYEISALQYKGEKISNTEKDIKKYRYIVHSGNAILDTILTEKIGMFEKYSIEVCCVVDESLEIEFIDVVDLYIILGNALDNAFESLKDSKTLKKRYVNIRIFQQDF